jgi:cytochrome c oxidase subunit 2
MNEFFGKLMGLPLLASTHGKDVDLLILYLHYMMGILFVGWTIYFFYAIWRFRKSRSPKADYVGATTHASSWIEVGVAVAEMVLLFFMAIPYWATSVESFPDEKSSTVLRVIAAQFNWTARYPGADGVFGKQDITLVSAENPMGLLAKDPNRKAEDPQGADDVVAGGSEIAVPVNKPVIAHMTSLDVIHSFKVVPLRVTQDCNPGMDIPVHFIPTVTNTYLIQCSQLCGNGHYSMKGTFKVLGTNEYAAWLESKPKVGAKAVSFE